MSGLKGFIVLSIRIPHLANFPRIQGVSLLHHINALPVGFIIDLCTKQNATDNTSWILSSWFPMTGFRQQYASNSLVS